MVLIPDRVTMTEIWIRASGTPVPQGSKTAGLTKSGRAFVRDANPRLKDWRETVAQATWQAMDGREPLEGPVHVDVWLYFHRPKSNRTTHPISRKTGDGDKHLRAINDAITDGGGWLDDSQIVSQSFQKLWADEHAGPGVVVWISNEELI